MRRLRLQDQFSPYVRFVLGGQAVITWYSATVNPKSTLHQVASTEDGGLLVWGIGIFGMLMLFDLFVNDWTPPCVRLGQAKLNLGWERVWQYRHWLFVGIAACYAAQPHIADVTGQSVAVVLVCYWNSLVNMIAAFIDAGERSRRLWWQRTHS